MLKECVSDNALTALPQFYFIGSIGVAFFSFVGSDEQHACTMLNMLYDVQQYKRRKSLRHKQSNHCGNEEWLVTLFLSAQDDWLIGIALKKIH